MAAELGFEPRQTESESVVLPLHNSAIAAVFQPLLENISHAGGFVKGFLKKERYFSKF